MTVPETAVDWPRLLYGLRTARLCGSVPGLRERLERARSHMHAHFDEGLDLDALAHRAAFSRFHFLREFRKAFGTTPHQYLRQRRLEAAKQMLQETDLSVTEVCMAVGYESLGSFSTLFQRHIGHSPMRYRAKIVQVPRWPLVVPRIPACFVMKLGPASFPL